MIDVVSPSLGATRRPSGDWTMPYGASDRLQSRASSRAHCDLTEADDDFSEVGKEA